MLAVVSDLHLQDTALDSIRHRAGDGRVREARIRRNVSANALRLLLRGICARAHRHRSKLVEIVLAGDIFEIHRTPRWLLEDDLDLRPWREIGDDLKGNPLRAKVAEILEAIHDENRDFFGELRGFVATHEVARRDAEGADALPADTEVVVRYLPGNHDRLLNAWPSVRRRVREILGIADVHGRAFDNTIERPEPGGNGLRIRHGHEYDRANFGIETRNGKALGAALADYLRPCFGDWITIDLAARLAVAFRAQCALEIRSERDSTHRDLYAALTEFDDVRPASLLLEYLSARSRIASKKTFRLLRDVLRDVYENALRDGFLVSEAKRLGYAAYLRSPYRDLILGALKHAAGDEIVSLARKIAPLAGDGPGPADVAKVEAGIREGDLGLVVAGHTHAPDQVPLPSPARDDRPGVFYLDTGTWRTTLPSGPDLSFGRLRAYTMLFAFDEDERKAVDDGRRFDTWTGHLAAEDYGYEDRDAGPLGPPTARLRFTRVRILKVDEGEKGFWRNGAEVRLDFGVDDRGFAWAKDDVRNGDEEVLADTYAADLYPTLDGELWARGKEEDFGRSVIDMDDPLPWAIRRLPRADGGFAPGPGTVRLEDRLENHLEIDYEVIGLV